jgi:DNA-binding transcriptional regulator YiaG
MTEVGIGEIVKATSLNFAEQEKKSAPTFVAVTALMAVTAFLPGGPTSSGGSWSRPAIRSLADQPVLGGDYATAEEAETKQPAEQVKALHNASGLTWEQLARLFGVSRRAVHHWASGGNMTARNIETLTSLMRTVSALAGSDPASRRMEILMPGDNGTSLYERLLSRHRPDMPIIEGSYLPPEYLLGAQKD